MYLSRIILLILPNRNEKFKFTSGVSSAEIFDKLQSRLISRYGSSMQIERRTVSSENIVCVRYGNFTYDIFLILNTI